MGDDPFRLPEMNTVWQQTLNWQPTEQQSLKFQQLFELILAGTRQLNLTRITDPLEFWEKHLWDSLRGITHLLAEDKKTENERSVPASLPHSLSFKVIDIGTGAGFPGVPIAVVRPDWTVTLLDATRKKIAFLKTLLAALDIHNVTTSVDRAEQMGQHPVYRETYDIALVRAVGSASVCAEYALPLLQIDGLAILYRGHWSDTDTITLQPAVEKLGGTVESIEEFITPVSQSVRHCLYLRKVAATPIEFPRPIGLPVQQPL